MTVPVTPAKAGVRAFTPAVTSTRLWVSAFFAFVWFVLVAPASQATEPLRAGAVPRFEAAEQTRDWNELLVALARHADRKIEYVPAENVQAYLKEVNRGTFDLAFLSPSHYLVAHRNQGYVPLIRSQEPLVGVLVVSRRAKIKNVDELNEKTVAFPAPNSFGASVLLRAELLTNFGVRFKPKYVKTHDNVYAEVANGLAVAGGGIQETFDKQPLAVRDKLRILHKTEPMPSHLLAAHPRLPSAMRERLRAALFALDGTPEGKKLLQRITLRTVHSATHAEYEPLERLKLESFAAP
jgi:phosphonate transport system substrate-binding protein